MEPTDAVDAPVAPVATSAFARPSARAFGAAAVVLMTANLVGSILGFARGVVITSIFGATIHTDGFIAASIVPQMFFDLTVGAAVSAALIPTFTELWHRDGREHLARTVGAVLGLAWLVLTVVIVMLIVFARPLMSFLLITYHQKSEILDIAVPIVRLMVPALIFMGTSAIVLSSLYSMRRFAVSAFAASLYHVGIILGAILLARPLGILALPIGAVIGAAAQTTVQIPALLHSVGRVRPYLGLTPEVRQIIRLYLPVAVGLVVSIVGQILDIIFKAHLGRGPITWMAIATTLVQFPIGIAAAAMGFAILPIISADASSGRIEHFKSTLTLGMRVALFLTIPAAIGYLALAHPIVSLLFERGRFHAHDAFETSTALVGYAIQIPFVGIDQLLIASFYARKNTVTPMTIGVVCVVIYVVSALALMPRWDVLGLALANTIQNSAHAVILLVLLVLAIGGFRGTGLTSGLLRIGASAAVMAGVVVATFVALDATMHGTGLHVWAPEVAIPMATGVATYLATAALLRSEELRLFRNLAFRKRAG